MQSALHKPAMLGHKKGMGKPNGAGAGPGPPGIGRGGGPAHGSSGMHSPGPGPGPGGPGGPGNAEAVADPNPTAPTVRRPNIPADAASRRARVVALVMKSSLLSMWCGLGERYGVSVSGRPSRPKNRMCSETCCALADSDLTTSSRTGKA